jgi:L-ascorbate metabolism protein UlaG (beta-lactamase superfamily)
MAMFFTTGGLSNFGAKPDGARRERIERSPQFVGGHFRNTSGLGADLQQGTYGSLARKYFFGDQLRRPPGPLPIEDPSSAWRRTPASGLRATWLGHSSILLELDGFRVLTDPVWGERASPSSILGPKRFHPPPVPLSALPRLDAVVISHDHYDHLDTPTIRELAQLGVPFFAPLGVGAHLEAWGVPGERITELDWWGEAVLPGTDLTFTATPAQHFSGRGIGDGNRTLWASWVIATPNRRVFFSGDTGLTRELEDIGARKGPFELVMLEVGAYDPAWGAIHLGPENAIVAHRMLGGGPLLPIHWGTFNLAFHAWDEPVETLARLAAERGIPLLTPKLGAPVEPASVAARAEAWWRSVGAKHAQAELPPPVSAGSH